jgi:RNA polymerase sigma-70 factor (ECF subfamily)
MTAFEALYRKHVHAVYRFAMSVTRRKETAEDLTSEAFLALYRHLDSIEESRLPAWLLTVVRNRARDLWRHEEIERRHAADVADTATGGMLDVERWILEQADLKPVHRACILLRYSYGLSRAEIAATLDLTEMQVKGHLRSGLSLLRTAYAASKKGPDR